MCGGENAFPPGELVPVQDESRWGELDTSLRGTCRACGEPIDVSVPADSSGPVSAGRKPSRTEAVIAFVVLAALLLLFLVAVIAMDRGL